MMKAFRCSRTGMMFPADYVEQWGKTYGIGLGPVPVSEALVNDYEREIAGDGDTGMHPLSVCKSQVDMVEVDEKEFDSKKAIIDIDDPKLRIRGQLMREKQLEKSISMKSKFPIDANRIMVAKLAKSA
jgi:hypothetical protein